MSDQMPESEVPEHALARKRMSRADRLRRCQLRFLGRCREAFATLQVDGSGK